MFHPEDTVHVLLTFEHPADLQGASAYFRLIGDPRPNQRGFRTEFREGGQLTKLTKPAEYEFSLKIPTTVASGRYKLNQIGVSTAGATRYYGWNQDFQSEIIIRIESPVHADLPDLEDVTLGPGH